LKNIGFFQARILQKTTKLQKRQQQQAPHLLFMSNNPQQQLPHRPIPQQQDIPTAPPLQTALNRS
jgi:hypothetical protein